MIGGASLRGRMRRHPADGGYCITPLGYGGLSHSSHCTEIVARRCDIAPHSERATSGLGLSSPTVLAFWEDGTRISQAYQGSSGYEALH
jgi:hypothetical protein